MSKLAFSSLVMLVMLCAPAQAQSGPSASQYEPCDPGSEACASSIHESVEDVVDNAEKGTSAVNGAMDETMGGAAEAPTDGASDVSTSASSAGSPLVESEAGVEGAAAGPGGITKLPETGGVSPALLGLGLVLVTLGLMARKAVGR